MAYMSFTVDTHPMAQEIESVSQKVKGTTAAVVGMQTAVVAAEAEARMSISDSTPSFTRKSPRRLRVYRATSTLT